MGEKQNKPFRLTFNPSSRVDFQGSRVSSDASLVPPVSGKPGAPVAERLLQRLVKTGGRLVKHARYFWLLLAEGHLTRRLVGAMVRRIWAVPLPGAGSGSI
jgi:hypothetical protein